MRKAILAFSCVLCLSFGALSTSAKGPGPKGAGVEGNKVHTHWHWWHHEKQKKDKATPLYGTPKSVGGWFRRRGPGPAGAGTK